MDLNYETVTYTKVEPAVVKEHRRFFKNHVKRAFVRWCAYHHKLDAVLTKSELEQAKKGSLPKDLDVHHIIPLSGTYDPQVNEFFNLAILHKSTHKLINRECFQPQLRQLQDKPFGTELEIQVPIFQYVDTNNILAARRGEQQNLKTLTKIQELRAKYCR